MRRRKVADYSYDAGQPGGVVCTSSGAYLLDLALGGGWANSRVVNIVGDRSSGKTLLAIEAGANFAQISGADYVRYAESEDAYDDAYGRMLGMPEGISRPDRPLRTVEDFYNDLTSWLAPEVENAKKRKPPPSLYILDSLDALSDTAEMGRPFSEGSFGTGKAKDMSKLFRMANNTISVANCTLMIISQVRQNIGVMFGDKRRRSGGDALDFYASQIVWLSEKHRITQTVLRMKRAVGIEIVANVRKNKIGLPFRQAPLTIMFNYGVDDEKSIADWLKETGQNVDGIMQQVVAARRNRELATLDELSAELRQKALDRWTQIEASLQPSLRKYR